MQRGYQCGMIWGAALAAGAEAHRRLGAGPQAEAAAVAATRRILDAFRASNDTVNCIDITGLDHTSSSREMTIQFFLKGGIIRCYRMAAKYAPLAFNAIETALSEGYADVPSPPLSCAAVLAQKMGTSDMHSVMASGLAGGIGLSGEGCGALGAAIWLIGLDILQEGDEVEYKSPRNLETIARFAACTDSEFTCSAIVGRKFVDIDDHAAYLRDGGCSEIIEALAAA